MFHVERRTVKKRQKHLKNAIFLPRFIDFETLLFIFFQQLTKKKSARSFFTEKHDIPRSTTLPKFCSWLMDMCVLSLAL